MNEGLVPARTPGAQGASCIDELIVQGTGKQPSLPPSKRQAPSWLAPVDLGASLAAVDTQRVDTKNTKGTKGSKKDTKKDTKKKDKTASGCPVNDTEGSVASTMAWTDDEDETDKDAHAWMKEVLRMQILGRGGDDGDARPSTSEGRAEAVVGEDGDRGFGVQIAEEGLDALAACLGGILDRVLVEAKGGVEDIKELTSRDIHGAIKTLFREEGTLRPILPGVVKRSWMLDKESLPKGVKKRKCRK